jgi:hypothetical protein
MPTDKTVFLDFTHTAVITAFLQPQYLLAIVYSLHRTLLHGDVYADVQASPLKLLSMWNSVKTGISRSTLKGIRHT